MFSSKHLRNLLCAGVGLIAAQASFASSNLIDSESFELASGNKTQMVRFGAQSEWNKTWFQSNGMHLGGYWDATAALWRGNQYKNIAGDVQNITDIGFTPVFRYEHDNKKGIYAEAGIGAHRLSDLYNNDGRQLSTRFEFGDHIGIGYVSNQQWEVGMKIQHFSNGGYKHPNSGVNFLVLKASFHL